MCTANECFSTRSAKNEWVKEFFTRAPNFQPLPRNRWLLLFAFWRIELENIITARFIYCRILIGAPEDESPLATSNSLSRPGSVYRCTSRPPFQCSVIPFDNTGNNNVSGSAIDEKSHQWFGASISSSGIDGYVVVRNISKFYLPFTGLVINNLTNDRLLTFRLVLLDTPIFQ